MKLRLYGLAGVITSLMLFAPPEMSASQAPSDGLVVKQVKGWQIPHKPVDMVQSPDESTIFVLTENHQVLVYEANGNLKGSFPVDPGVTAIDTNLRGERLLLIDGEQNVFRTLEIDFLVAINVQGSPFKGPADAPVTVTVFSDFE